MGVYEFQLTSQPTADLSLSLQVSNRTPNPNQPISYILTVTNNGPSPATNVIWQNRLPDNLTFVGGDNVSATNGILSGQIGSLTSGASASFTYQLRPTQSGRYVNAAQLTFADQPDPDSQPDSGTGDGQDDAAAIEIRTANGDGPVFVSANPNQVPLPPLQSNQPTPDPNKIDLSLALSVSNRSPRVGDLLTYTLVVSNRGGATASTVNVIVYLPNGQSFDSGDSLTPTSEALSGGVNTLAPGAQAVFIYKTRATQPGAAITRAQIRQASPPDVDSTPDNGTENGEDDTAQISIRTVSN